MSKKKIIMITIAIIGLGFLFGGYFFNKWYHKDIKNHPKMYVYQTFWGAVNSAMIVEDEKYKYDLVAYYEQAEKGENPTFNFPLKTLPQYEPVYVIEFTKDSLLAKVISYYDYGATRGGSFTKGWVYAKCLHQVPPPKKEAKN